MNDTTQIDVRRAAPVARPAGSMFGLLQREIDRLFDEFNHVTWPSLATAGASVSMDLAETKDGFELTAEVPGLEEKDVKVSLSDRLLTISGEKAASREETDKNYRFTERSFGAFSRSIELPADVEADKISATLSNGVLKVSVPRSAKAEPKQIEVKRAA